MENESEMNNLLTLLHSHVTFEIHTFVEELFLSRNPKTIPKSLCFLQVFCLLIMDQFMKLTKLAIRVWRPWKCNTKLAKMTLLALTIRFSNCGRVQANFQKYTYCTSLSIKGWYHGHTLAELRWHPQPVISWELQVQLLRWCSDRY